MGNYRYPRGNVVSVRLASNPANNLLATYERNNLLRYGSFRPTDVPGLRRWHETGDQLNIYCHEATGLGNPCEDGEACLGWEDRSGNALHLTEATNGPAFQIAVTTEAASPNGKGRLEFDATNDVLTGGGVSQDNYMHDGTGGEMFIVFQSANEVNAPIFDTTNKLAGIGACFYNDDSGASEGRISFCGRNGSGNIFNIQAASTAGVCPVGEWHCVHGDHLTADGARLLVDNCFIGSASAASPSSSNAASAAKLGLDFASGFTANKYAAIISYARKLTQSERNRVVAYLSYRYGFAAGNVACIGDSITASYAANASSYPTLLAQKLGSMYRVVNWGVSGSTVNDGGTDIYNDQWLASVKRKRFNHIVSLGGINDIRGSSDSAATIFARYQTLLDEVIGEPSNRLFLCTLLPFKNDSAWTSGKQAVLEGYNTLIRQYAANNSNTTQLVDLYSQMGDPADATAMRYDWSLDGLHPNQIGMDIIASAVADKMLTLGLL